MAGISGRAAVLSVSRLANQALLLVSPIVLAHLLPVAEFGRYREFLVYATVLLAFATLSINNSLLYFVPSRPEQARRYVRQSVLLVAAASTLTVAVTAALDFLLGGQLVGGYLLPLAIYVLVYANLDFWEFLWLAQKRIGAVFAYATGRMLARVAVVVAAAALARDVYVIIWSLVALESVRFLVSLVAWARANRRAGPPVADAWREQGRYCGPIAGMTVLITANQQLANLFIAKGMGPIALAHYTIGTYVQPIVSVFRNSLSDVLLPEMSRQSAQAREAALALWKRSTVVYLICLLPVGILLARYADLTVTTLFSDAFAPAVPIFQIYLLVLLRECFDFGVLLRAFNETRPILYSNLLALAVNAALLIVLLPAMGLVGAVIALLVARFADGAYLAFRAARLLEVPLSRLIPWADLAKVGAAALAASVLLMHHFELARELRILEAVVAGIVFVGAFLLLLRPLKVTELTALLGLLSRKTTALRAGR